MKPIPDKPYFRPDEVARIIGVSLPTVRRWLSRGLILHIHCVGLVRIPSGELERILREGVKPKK